MRVYFMKDCHIRAVEMLKAQTDEGRVIEARSLFESIGQPKGADGFEVWDRDRFIYRWPEVHQPHK
jgi:hypothetical protein